jgi:uncharacterized protein (DUF1015 family)
MAKIFPFRAFHYNTKKIGDLSDVIIPPYDNIPKGDDEKYLARSPYNFAHVLLPQSKEEDYSRSKTLLGKWFSHDILVTDPEPGYYLYRQTFTLGGTEHRRDTLMCTVELQDFSDGVVRPHENTFGVFKNDRLQILRQTHSNLSHVFGMVKDPQGYLNSIYERWEFQAPLLHGKTDDGGDHAVWKVDAGKVPELARYLETQPIYIVDGHHRYESALTYAREIGALGKPGHPASRMLFSLANAYDPALIVLPTHRIVRHTDQLATEILHKRYDLVPMSEQELQAFVAKPRKTPDFGLYWQGKLHRCTPKHWDRQQENLGKALYRLAVTWSDQIFLPTVAGVDETNRKERVTYERELGKVWDARDGADLVIFHAPPAITDVMDVADARQFMPQKSTYFHPKLAAGLIMRDHEKA